MKRTMRKPRPVWPRLARPPRKGLVYPVRKGREAVQEDQPPRRHAPPSTASIARWWMGPIRPTIQAIVVGLTRMAEVGKPHKPFDPAKKPWKKGGGDSGQMAYLTEKLEKLEKKLKKSKSKKSSKKRSRDSSSDSSDSK